MKPLADTRETRRDATDCQHEAAWLIAHAGPGAACPDDRAPVLAALADTAGLLRAQGASCPGCELPQSSVCGDHEQALVRAEGYNRLAAQLSGQR
jgi:hypothetical protein